MTNHSPHHQRAMAHGFVHHLPYTLCLFLFSPHHRKSQSQLGHRTPFSALAPLPYHRPCRRPLIPPPSFVRARETIARCDPSGDFVPPPPSSCNVTGPFILRPFVCIRSFHSFHLIVLELSRALISFTHNLKPQPVLLRLWMGSSSIIPLIHYLLVLRTTPHNIIIPSI
jgi:hypothetical protein